MPTIFVPAEPYPKQANDNIRSSDWNAAINEVSRLSDTTQYLNRNIFNGPLTIDGALTANAALTVKGVLTASAGLTVTGDETVSGKLTVNGTALSELKGPVTVSGLLTASAGLTVNGVLLTANKGLTVTGGVLTAGAGLTVTGDETVSGKLTVNGTALSELKGPVTVSGLLTASNGLTLSGALTASGGLTVNGNLTVNGVLGVSTYTRISQQTSGNWAVFGANMYNTGTGFRLVNTAQPGANLHMSAEGGGTSQFRFCIMDANEQNQRNIATIGTGGLTVTGGINGPITVNGALTVTGALTATGGINGPLTIRDSLTLAGSLLTMEGLAVISTNVGSGRWANFGSNLYYRGNQWNLATTAQPGVSLIMSGTQSGNREFCFVRVEANSTSSPRDLVTIGSQGIIVYNGKKVTTAGEFLYMVRGQVENGAPSVGTGYTVSRPNGTGNGIYQINFNPAFSNWPVVVATQMGPQGNSTLDNALIVRTGFEFAQIKVGSSSGAGADRAFTFIAVGPR